MSNKPYTYDGLDQKTIERAKKELNENPSQVRAHIESFRRWVWSMPHLHCPTDDEFLLRFLRQAKFDHSKAEKRLDNYCTMRGSPTKGVPHWFNFPSIDDPVLDDFFAMKMLVPLGYCDDGQFVILLRPKLWDGKFFPMERIVPLMYMGLDILMSDQNTVIHGVTSIVDLDGVGRKFFDAWGNQKNLKTWVRNLQESYPMRLKNDIYYKEPMIFDVIFKMIEFWLKDKLKKRIYRVKDNLKKIHARVPGAKRILPTEYGGEAGSVDELVNRWHNRYLEVYANGNPLKDIRVDESKRPVTTVNYMGNYEDYPDDAFGKQGTYTKLNV